MNKSTKTINRTTINARQHSNVASTLNHVVQSSERLRQLLKVRLSSKESTPFLKDTTRIKKEGVKNN
jgi:hypothetical protein